MSVSGLGRCRARLVPDGIMLSARTDRLVHHGRNFGRTISTFRGMLSLIDEGVVRTEQIANIGVDIEELEER